MSTIEISITRDDGVRHVLVASSLLHGNSKMSHIVPDLDKIGDLTVRECCRVHMLCDASRQTYFPAAGATWRAEADGAGVGSGNMGDAAVAEPRPAPDAA